MQYMMNEVYNVHMIDIQDTYLLAYQKDGADQNWNAFKDILQAIDSSVLVEPLGKHVSLPVKHRMNNVIKDTIQPQNTRLATMQQLTNDINVLQNTIVLEERYNFHLPLFSESVSEKHLVAEIENSLKPVASLTTEGNTTSVQAADYAAPQYANYLEAARVAKAQTFTIIWSRLNNMSVVYEECGKHECSADQACEACLNFDVVQKVAFNDGHVEHFKAMFHQKIWDNLQQLQEKVKCFEQLYEMSAIASESSTKTERQRVLDLLHDGFDLSNDPAKRIKASELTALISAKLAQTGTEQAAGFKQRLPAYLLEAGLQKKRLSEGIFYYGIQASVSTRFEQNRAHTVKELEEQRDAQMLDVKATGYKIKPMQNLSPGDSDVNPVNLLEEMYMQKILPDEIPRDDRDVCRDGTKYKIIQPVEAKNVVYSTFF